MLCADGKIHLEVCGRAFGVKEGRYGKRGSEREGERDRNVF
jgi:hypothetical protein